MAEALARVTPKLAKEIIGTGIIQGIMIGLGFILFFIPGFVFSVKYIFSLMVVIYEGTPYWQALQRSSELTKGHGWQIFIHAIAFAFPLAFVLALILKIFRLSMELLLNADQSKFAMLLLGNILQPIVFSMIIIFILAMYLDLRGTDTAAIPGPVSAAPTPAPADKYDTIFPPADEQ